jgi:NAD-dependent deacetylase
LWRNRRFEQLAHLDTFERQPAEFWDFYSHRLAALGEAAPNPAHRALARLEDEGLIDAVITQNVDGLHRAAGSSTVFELHGSLREGECIACREAVEQDATSTRRRPRWPIDEVMARRTAAADGVPRCDCGSPLKPAVVLFGEQLPAVVLETSFPFVDEADYALCLGSSLEVMPAAALPQIVLSNGGSVAIINQGSTAYDDAERVLKVDAGLGAAMPVVLEAALAARAASSSPRRARRRQPPPVL